MLPPAPPRSVDAGEEMVLRLMLDAGMAVRPRGGGEDGVEAGGGMHPHARAAAAVVCSSDILPPLAHAHECGMSAPSWPSAAPACGITTARRGVRVGEALTEGDVGDGRTGRAEDGRLS